MKEKPSATEIFIRILSVTLLPVLATVVIYTLLLQIPDVPAIVPPFLSFCLGFSVSGRAMKYFTRWLFEVIPTK